MRPAIEKFLQTPQPLFACPLCRRQGRLEPLTAAGASLRCQLGHTFDINRRGYVDLRHRPSSSNHYTADFFAARQRVMRAGLYSQLLQALQTTITELGLLPAAGLDIGCGDGFITRSLGLGAGLDIAMPAVAQAARGGGSTLWVCADGAWPPFLSGTFDWILNVFAPAEYGEFARLAPAGVLVKVVPGPQHMQELRAVLGLAEPAEETSLSLFRQRIELLADPLDIVQTTLLQTDEARRDVALMSPVAFNRLPANDKPVSGSDDQGTAAASTGLAEVESWQVLAAVTTHCRLLVGRLS